MLEGFDGDTPRLRAPASRATVKQLVTHTAGLGYWFWDADLVQRRANFSAGHKWGYGLLLNTEDVPGMQTANSGAWAGLMNTHFLVDPTTGVTGAIYTQFLPFVPEEAMRMYADFEKAVYASL